MAASNLCAESIYRQVVTEHFQSNNWRDILINPEGASTTLRDESTLPRSGGYRFKDIPNRFLFWRVLYDKLELVEHSLDTNLTENQVRIHFRDSPVLDSGISVYETSESVVLLVPTACSCHRFSFPRPNCIDNEIQNENVWMDASIFSNFNIPSIDDPATFYSYNAELSHPYSAASCLDQKHDAIFIIALQNNVMLYIRLEYISGLPTLKEICQESAVPRMLSNITKVFSTHVENPVINSLAVHPFQQDIYVYSLDEACELKVWSIEKSVYIYIMDMKKLYASSAENGSRPHIIHKRSDDQLLLTIYLSLSESSKFVVLEPCTDHGMFKLQQKFYVCSPMNNRLVDMAFYGDEIWCIWRTGKDVACIKSVNIKSGEWKNCILDTTAFEQLITYSPNIKETYLNKIFSSPTYFTENDLKNAITVYDTSDNYEFVTDYRSKISNAIDTKVSQEMDKYDSSDLESQWQLVEQCSASFYKSCLDYRRKRLAPLGLIWLGPSSNLLVIITNSSFCFLRPTDNIEHKIFSMNNAVHENELNRLINVLMLDQKHKSSQFLDINIPSNNLISLIKEFYKFDNSNPKVTLFLNGRNICDTVRSLILLLYVDAKNAFEKSFTKIFKSNLGISVISHSFHQMVLTRFDLCCRLLALMELNTRSYGQTSEFVIDARTLVHSYWILAVFSQDIKLCEKMYLINHQILVKTSFIDCIKNLLEYTWPLNNGSTIANFLLEEKKYNFIQSMAHLLDYSKWDETLVMSYMLNNEPDKALDVMKNDINKETSQFLKTITLFEKHGYYKHAIQLGKHVLEMALHNGDEHMSSMFYSNIFLNNLKIKAYKDAYNNILSLKDQDRKLNCLHTFVLTLLENGEKEQLLSFNFSGLQSAVEDIVLKKARSLSNVDAAVYYMFLCSMHDKYHKYKKLAITFYELYVRADTNVEQEQYLRLSLLYLETLSSEKAWFVTTSLPCYSKSVYTSDKKDGLIQIDDLKKLCLLARARQEIEDSTTDVDVQSVISVLIMKHKYKEVLRLSKLWNLPIHYPLRELVKTCLTLVDPEESEKAWIWLADNGVNGDGIDSAKIAWRFLETLVNRYEEKNLTLLHYHVADELLRNKAFLPNWLVKTYKERNIGELLQLYLSYGELLSCACIVSEFFEVVMDYNELNKCVYGETVPTDIIECLIVNLKHHNLPLGDELLEKYKIFCDKIVIQESKKLDEINLCFNY
ncbi:nuclear pore complex protein Nup160 [Daktulosphaira vitifoliae]|uniref:nuclear pore complex protein Nup160 n=1 Tax=Daktulosphaira vitifoliae TaxID=58002 RepID=UPI0021A984FC|nr:nuclear pore complex protein Nup160 [Daktulosphaira vitifoliae]